MSKTDAASEQRTPAKVVRTPVLNAAGEREPGLWRRQTATGEVFEITWRDGTHMRRRTVPGGITAARKALKAEHARRDTGAPVSHDPRLTFGAVATRWLDGPVASLRPATRAVYRNAIDTHLRPLWDRKRLDHVSTDDVSTVVRTMRAEGLSEWTIAGVIKAASAVYGHAYKREGWRGVNPVTLLERGEKPKPRASRKRIYEGDELAQTLRVAHEPYRTLFALAAASGARLSELLGLTWADVSMADLDDAEVRFEYQVDRAGERVELKTDESRRPVPLAREIAALLPAHRVASADTSPGAFVFATRTGRPLGQRNVLRALRATQKRAVTDAGLPTFPRLHAPDCTGAEPNSPTLCCHLDGEPPRDAAPNFHGFRHTAASYALRDGDTESEVAWMLGHKNSTVTRAVYLHEVRDSERRTAQRAKQARRVGSMLAADDGSSAAAGEPRSGENVRRIRG